MRYPNASANYFCHIKSCDVSRGQCASIVYTHCLSGPTNACHVDYKPRYWSDNFMWTVWCLRDQCRLPSEPRLVSPLISL